MIWNLKISDQAKRHLAKIDRPDRERILRFVHDRVLTLDEPTDLGTPLKGHELGSYWRFRVGDYRIICDLQSDVLVVLMVDVGHRSKIYR